MVHSTDARQARTEWWLFTEAVGVVLTWLALAFLAIVKTTPNGKSIRARWEFYLSSAFLAFPITCRFLFNIDSSLLNYLIIFALLLAFAEWKNKKQKIWFPRRACDLDQLPRRILEFNGSGLDDPAVKDFVYRTRRNQIGSIALTHKHGQTIPRIQYNKEEVKTWGVVYRALRQLHARHACKEYNEGFALLEAHCNFSEHTIPQLEDISNYLEKCTDFRLRPIGGQLSSRDFLAGLAFRTFHATQYIRHGANPFFSVEVDACHDLLGHMPLLTNKKFADFSHEIGLASLGASEETIKKLDKCYWYTAEFGLSKEEGRLKAYGAGLLGCVKELQFAMESNEAERQAYDPSKATVYTHPDYGFQGLYLFSESIQEAMDKTREFLQQLLVDPVQ
ncbi:phenylalanine-4-hydroxylase-like isoform X2 [Oscarella lobularis]|uniref:phenylalanine-4-hydroxylase-like isoform X2 n=1 Tax=Oscarella lobularis TaxID=121494 RepID=UPI0033135E3A